jgi:hypothetical protein
MFAIAFLVEGVLLAKDVLLVVLSLIVVSPFLNYD